jgi:phytoene dehydrogenase-like protein
LRIVMIGGSAAGLVTALLLAREGHVVTVLDRHDLEWTAAAEVTAKTAFRRSAPQIPHTHSYHPPIRHFLRELLPDVDIVPWAAGPSSLHRPIRCRGR